MSTYTFIGEKVFYSVTIETETETNRCRLELLTGNFNDNNYNEIINCLEWLDLPEMFNYHAVTMAVLDSISNCWDAPENVEFPGSRDTDHAEINISIEREETEPGFSHSGCDICRSGLGTNVYECIGYDDATRINEGEYTDIDVCGDCLYEYHYGVS